MDRNVVINRLDQADGEDEADLSRVGFDDRGTVDSRLGVIVADRDRRTCFQEFRVDRIAEFNEERFRGLDQHVPINRHHDRSGKFTREQRDRSRGGLVVAAGERSAIDRHETDHHRLDAQARENHRYENIRHSVRPFDQGIIECLNGQIRHFEGPDVSQPYDRNPNCRRHLWPDCSIRADVFVSDHRCRTALLRLADPMGGGMSPRCRRSTH